MAVIPAFEPNGLLPPGDYAATFEELRQSILVLGPGDPSEWPNWDAAWRMQLVRNLETLTRQLWRVGITEVFADGSFAEDKDHPNDVDGYFVCDLNRLRTGELVRELNLLDPNKIWTWDPASRRPYRGYPKLQFRCGTRTGSSFTRTSRDCSAASATSTATNWNSHRRSVNRGATAHREAL